MTYESNPFDWGFEESSSLKTLTQQLNPIYSEPMEVTEQKEDLYDFFGQDFGHSPNIAHVVGTTPLPNPPYTNV